MEYYIHDDNIGQELLKTLHEIGGITESRAKLIDARSKILNESKTQQPSSVYKFNINYTTPQGKQTAEFSVKWEDFWNVYSDLVNYVSYRDMLVALGVNANIINNAADKIEKTTMQNMTTHFRKNYGRTHLIPTRLMDTPQRGIGRNGFKDKLGYNNLADVPFKTENGQIVLDYEAIQQKMGEKTPEEFLDQLTKQTPDKDNIDFGTRGQDTSRTGRVVSEINKQELFSGEFYSNMSRIPKSSIFNWLRVWKKDTVGLRGEKKSWLSLGRRWRKVFIMGYQLDKKFLYEIWFNTIDSTYTLHDQHGGELSKRVKTLAEAFRYLFLQLAKVGPKDVEFMQNPVDRATLDSFILSMRTYTDARTQEMLDREKKADDLEKQEFRDKQERIKKLKAKIGDVTSSTVAAASVAGSVAAPYAKTARDEVNNAVTDYMGKPFVKREMDDDYEYVTPKNIKKLNATIRTDFSQRIRNHLKAKKTFTNVDEIENVRISIENEREKTKSKIINSQLPNEEKLKLLRVIEIEFDDSIQTLNDKAKEIQKDRALKAVNENTEVEFADMFSTQRVADEFANEVSDFADKPAYNNRVSKLKTDAEKESINFKRLQEMFMDTIVKYTDETRLGRYGTTLFDRIINSARKDKVVYPGDRRSILKRIGQFITIRGVRYRADFIAGYSLSDRVDFEIWFVTEPNPNYSESDRTKIISSFYVYDLTSGMLLRKFIPYYRNAEQVVLQKISSMN